MALNFSSGKKRKEKITIVKHTSIWKSDLSVFSIFCVVSVSWAITLVGTAH